MQYTHRMSEANYKWWAIGYNDFFFNTKANQANDQALTVTDIAIVDTGTSMIYFPKASYQTIVSRIE